MHWGFNILNSSIVKDAVYPASPSDYHKMSQTVRLLLKESLRWILFNKQ